MKTITQFFLVAALCLLTLPCQGLTQKIQVKGNTLVDADGQVLVLKGLALNDPAVLTKENEWNEKHFDHIKQWNVTVVRIPVTPIRWRKEGKEFYFKAIEQAVHWCKARGIYIILDWHSIGNLHENKYQRPNYNTTI
ncbi:MAG: cellulase family glycosylhydrolase, partial [Lentisphaeraceae bacterium]|nr:cellulase family glycosylhydrolase [Lentisphaeraceae bacterium]